MQVKPTLKQVEYEVASRVIIGGRVYLPPQRVTLDSSDGEILAQRGFLRAPRANVAQKHEPNAEKEPPIPANQVGIVTKDELSAQMEEPEPDNPTQPRPEAPPKPGDTVPVDRKEQTNGKSARRGR